MGIIMGQVSKCEFNTRTHVRVLIRGSKVNLIDEKTLTFSEKSKVFPFQIDINNENHRKIILQTFKRTVNGFKIKFIRFNNGFIPDEPAGYIGKDGKFYPYAFGVPFASARAFRSWVKSDSNKTFVYAVFQLEDR